MASRSCSFTFSPPRDTTDSDAHLSATDCNEDGVWECPHDALEGRERCLAHLEGNPDGIDETDWLLEAVGRGSDEDTQRDRRRRKQFVAGRFDDLDVTSTVEVRDDEPLDLRYCEIGSFRCADVSLTDDLDFSVATVGTLTMNGTFDRLRAVDAEIDELSLKETRIRRLDCRDGELGTVSLRNGSVELADLRDGTVGELDLDEASIARGQFDRASFETLTGRHASLEIVDFDDVTVETIDFYYAEFGQADFRDVTAVDAVFKGADFDGAYFNDADIAIGNWLGTTVSNGHFSGVRFEQAAFRKATIESADFPDCHFGWVNFQQATFGDADFRGSIFEHVSFRNADFETADFGGIDCAGALNLAETTFETDLLIEPAPSFQPVDSFVDLTDSHVPTGTLRQSESGRVVYDIAGATIGKVTFEANDPDVNLVDRIHVLRTRFERFDFRDSDDIELKRSKYALHEMFDGAEEVVAGLLRYGLMLGEAREETHSELRSDGGVTGPTAESDDYRDLRARVNDRLSELEPPTSTTPNYRNPSTRDLEYTYLLAKNGANEIHDNDSSSMFFIREMQQRRTRHRELAVSTDGYRDKLHHGINWTKNSILWWSAGYGERPSRVISTSVVLIGFFSLLYYAVSPTLYENPLNYAVLSIGSFVTLIIGSVGDIPVTSINLLSQIQAFIGAFLIAMFVFTLTRSIHR
ncbi:pentapeptide repeat-containing protein [Natronoglomus mannanivorans]|uniref:Pentapeptide repeat-containing protein n=1 Tax=Natronoglomus mannanivorans TaxID=2979990 RepID=A0AAP2YYW0_9EURY|nr:pentapeptide repeat-containing protein [Halobacteria archaeon AArc-xg1-1]